MARLVRGGRWAALATYGDGVPPASMAAYAGEAGFAGFLLHLSRPESSLLFGFEDFILFRLVPREARFVAGMARACIVTAAELKEVSALRPGP